MNTKLNLNELKNPELIGSGPFIGGKFIHGEAGQLKVHNPATDEVLFEVGLSSNQQVQAAIKQANDAQQIWRATPAKDKAAILQTIASELVRNQEDLATILTLEQGKPFNEAKGEILYSASYFEWFAGEARRIYGDVIPAPTSDRRIIVLKEPVGVVAAITPWNFPSAMIARKLAAAIAAGCAMVIKPAKQTPLSALAYGVIAKKAGIIDGLISVLPGNAEAIGREFTDNPLIKKISFTGSTEIGKLLMERAAKGVKRISFELGGNAPFIVFKDADIDQAVSGAILSKYRNAGQTCVCANRFYVEESVYEEFAAKLVAATKELKVGNGLEAGIDLGPLIDEGAIKKVEHFIADALNKGGELLLGGKRHPLGNKFFESTVIGRANAKMDFANDEIFGPLAPIFTFKDDDEVIKLANDTEFGLAAYFYSRDLSRIFKVAEALEYGMVGVNSGIISAAEAPFGGVKQSGMGREGSKYGLDDYLNIKYLCIAGLN